MDTSVFHYVYMALIFGSVFLVVQQLVAQKEELFLRLPEEEAAEVAKKKKQQRNLLKKALRFMEPISAKALPYIKQEPLKRALLSAGGVMTLLDFVSFKLLCVLSALLFGSIIFSTKPNFIIVAGFLAFFYPDMWLKKKITKRQNEIIKDLPNVIDLLHLCVNAGLDFMLAVSRVMKDFKPCPLRDELSEMWRESQIGRSRKQSLQNLSWRVNLPETTSFVRTLIQADKMGSPMGEALEIQAEELRVRRFQRGEAMAFKAPVKLLFPLMVFILPVVMVIVGGPVLLQFLRGSGGGMGL
ncbi:MAG: type II secretion system F family protein [Candidatus Omnitrophota bacterium]|nr:type II secretion system F family protein [Candidatus Omnitrophota bacterium]